MTATVDGAPGSGMMDNMAVPKCRTWDEKERRPNKEGFYLGKHDQTYLSQEIPPLVGFNLSALLFLYSPAVSTGF